MNNDKEHFIGHRKRIKDRFFSSSSDNISEYELLELILFWALPRKDVKPLSKILLKDFGSIGEIVYADTSRLLAVPGVTKSMCLNFKIVREVIRKLLQKNIMKKNILSSWGALIDYLKVTMQFFKTEQVRILFLNKKNILIADELQTSGTVDQTPIYPREIVKRVLLHEASAIILVHNHPSGHCTPSKSDIELTQKVVEACKSVNVIVHDHVIIGNNDFFSFKSNLLL